MVLRRRSAGARLASVAAFACLILVAEAAFAATPVVVRNRPGVAEQGPAASGGAFAWVDFTLDSGWDAFVKPAGEPRIHLNGAGESLGVGIDGSDVVYDRFRRHGADLRFFDLGTRERSAPPDGVNTAADESQPALSGDWLFFMRTGRGGENRTRVVLFNLDTSEQRVLSSRRSRTNYVVTNQVSGDWATWERCRYVEGVFTHCEVFVYRISTDATTTIPNPGGQQYSSSVTSDGTVYFARGGEADEWVCGTDVSMVRLPLGGSEQVIATIADGRDVFSSFGAEELDDSTTLLFERSRCDGTFSTGIYGIANADTAT
ncbi:MAG TPA: hypothetical protein VE032_02980 [Actinomycetota bacterium]|nr:hypothetical protein [Actinomycetota bacterium]